MKTIVLCLLLAALGIGCQKRATNPPIETQNSAQEVSIMVEKRLITLNPYNIEVGQSVHKIESHHVVTSQGVISNFTKEWITDVTEVEEKSADKLITTIKKVNEKADGDFIYEVKNVYAFPQLTTKSYLKQLEQFDEGVLSLVDELHQMSDQKEIEIVGLAYHNLKETNVSAVPPDLVKKAKDCKGIPNCRVNAHMITHDIVFLLSNGETQTYNIEWLISAEVPFFAGILRQCSTSLLPINSLRVLVKQCREVVDF